MTTESNNTTVEVSEARLLEITQLASKLRTKTVRVHDLSGVGYNDDEDCHRAADLLEALTRRSSTGVKVTEEMVERAARALCIEDGRDPDSLDPLFCCDHENNPMPAWTWWTDHARAALLASWQPASGGEG